MSTATETLNEFLKQSSKSKVLDIIRDHLTVNGERLRFEMSGYDSGKTGSNTLHNQMVLNQFAELGIYDYTKYLVVDFYKGSPKIYLNYWSDNENIEIDDLGGYTTSEIIYEVFKLTILSDKGTRRRI